MSEGIAIVPWGDVIEDFLLPIGMTAREMASDMSGGWLFGYVEALRLAGFRSIVVAPSNSVTRPERLVHGGTGCPFWLIPGRSSASVGSLPLRAVRQWATTPLAGYRQVLGQEGCGRLLVQDYERPQFDALVALGRALRLPVFATYQGGDRTLSRIERPLRSWSMRAGAGAIIASAAERARVTERYDLAPERVAPIPNPIDLAAWVPLPREEARASLGIGDERFLAVTHGRIDIRRKGLDLLLAGWSGPGELVLIGSGQDRERFAAMVHRRPDVRWIDSYTNDRALIRRWLSAADVYVSASRLEGMPVAPIEAMACGVPVIVSDAKGLEDLFPAHLPAGGLTFPSGDVAALSAAIGRLRDDGAFRRKLGAQARQVAEQLFSLESVGRALGAFLRTSP